MLELLDNLIKNIRDFGLEKIFRRYYSVYRAQVVSNADDTGRGLIEIKVPTLFGDNTLPHTAEPIGFAGASSGKGMFNPPEVDDWVMVMFEMGDPSYPLYLGGWYGDGELPEEFAYVDGKPTKRGFKNQYGHSVVFDETTGAEKVSVVTPAGHFFVMDDTSGKEALYFIHKSGAQFQADAKGVRMTSAKGAYLSLNDEDGSGTMGSPDGATASVKDNVLLMDKTGKAILELKDGKVQLTADGDLVLSGGTFTMKSGAMAMTDGVAQVAVGQGKVKIGTPAADLLALVDQILDGLMAMTVPTGVGPSGPPINMASFVKVKALLATIKG